VNSQTRLFLVLIGLILGGCNSRDLSGLTAPSPLPLSQGPTGLQPIVTGITPNLVSAAGGAWGRITGTQFEPGAIVRLGNEAAQRWVRDNTTIEFWTTGEPLGTVDVTVTNPGGFSGSLPAALTFVPRATLDFSGEWLGHAGDDYVIEMPFTIQHGLLVTLVCGSKAVVISPPPVVSNGEFSYSGSDGISIEGHVVSTVGAAGTINSPGCPTTFWWAERSGTTHSVAAHVSTRRGGP
jgi:hypothetical protein